MNAVILVILAASLSALANFLIHKTLQLKKTTEGYLLASFGCSSVLGFFYYTKLTYIPLSLGMLIAGSLAGFLVFLLMQMTTKALKMGPSSLTFAFQISGSLFPGVILFFLFGTPFGYELTYDMILGLLLVLIGLFWSAAPASIAHQVTIKWILLVCSLFLIHLAYTTLIQWRCLSYSKVPHHALIPFRCEKSQDVWFFIAMFFSAFILQGMRILQIRHTPQKIELALGSLAGFINTISTVLLFGATGVATPEQKGILFPLFSIGMILLCNLWSQLLYKENIHWRSNLLCVSGISIAFLF